jgi:hypothetical protein
MPGSIRIRKYSISKPKYSPRSPRKERSWRKVMPTAAAAPDELAFMLFASGQPIFT